MRGALLVALLTACGPSQSDLIASGLCEVEREELYRPPPVVFCVFQSMDICMVYDEIAQEPYLRLLWRCETGERFWRAK